MIIVCREVRKSAANTDIKWPTLRFIKNELVCFAPTRYERVMEIVIFINALINIFLMRRKFIRITVHMTCIFNFNYYRKMETEQNINIIFIIITIKILSEHLNVALCCYNTKHKKSPCKCVSFEMTFKYFSMFMQNTSFSVFLF